MGLAQTRVALIAFLKGALACAKDLEDAEAVDLITRALDKARSRQTTGVSPAKPH